MIKMEIDRNNATNLDCESSRDSPACNQQECVCGDDGQCTGSDCYHFYTVGTSCSKNYDCSSMHSPGKGIHGCVCNIFTGECFGKVCYQYGNQDATCTEDIDCQIESTKGYFKINLTVCHLFK
jgi:hypothetical protein